MNPVETPSVDARRRWLAPALLAVLGVFVVFYELGDYRTLTKHEGFVAVVSREMRTSGDWIVPRFGELPRLKKPPLGYWAAAASSWLCGTHAEWAVRLPSAIAALLLAGLVGWWAGRWYGRPAGIAAALVQISATYVISFARKAEVDMLLCLVTTSALCLVAGYRPEESRTRAFWRWATVLALVGVAWLAKFHYGPVMVLAVCVVWFAAQRWWRAFWNFVNPLGLLVVGAAVAVWPYLLLRQMPQAWEIWQTETLGRAVGELGREPIWYYLPCVFVQMAPWSLLLPLAAVRSWRRAWRSGDPRERFLWIWFGTQLLILTVSAFKHHHYLMAALPGVALILGRTLAEVAAEYRSGQRLLSRCMALGWATAAVVGAGVMYAVICRKWPHLQGAALAASGCLGLGSVAAVACLAQRRWSTSLAVAACTFVGCYVAVMGWIFPGRDSRLPVVRFADGVRRELPQEALCVFGLKEDPVVYYLAEPVFRLEERDRLAERLRTEGSLVVVAEARNATALAELAECRRLATVADHPDCPPNREEPLALFKLTRRVRIAVR